MSILPTSSGRSARRARAGTSKSSSVRARTFSAGSRPRIERGDRGRMREARARRSLKRGASSPQAQAQTWPSRPSSRRDSPASPMVLLWSRPTRSGWERHRRWRLPRPARRRHNRQRSDREGGGVRGPGLAAAVVAGALQSGVANEKRCSFIFEARSWATQVIGSDHPEADAARWPRRRAESEPGSLARHPSLYLRSALAVAGSSGGRGIGLENRIGSENR